MRLARLVPLILLLVPTAAHAFDYLEHSYFTDRACLEAQRRLAVSIEQGDRSLVPRYLALALTCPERWERPYCLDGYKQLEGGLNRLEEPPEESGDHPATLGDLAALPDHLSDFGPARGFPRASAPGLTETALEWLAKTGDAGGVISDVAEDACESDEPVPWDQVEQDVATAISEDEQGDRVPPISSRALSPAYRAPLPQGPHDPAGPYSFDNPHYLDMIRRNADHFGDRAYTTWLGFHSAGRAIAGRSCAEVLALDDDALEDLAEDFPPFDKIDWDALDEQALRREGCALISERIRRRLIDWSKRAEPGLVAPVSAELASLTSYFPSDARLLDSVSSALISLVFEGSGLHFLQDAQAAGHLRVVQQPHDLEASRFFHDTDGRAGLTASLTTDAGETAFVAFSDGFLLGPPLAHPDSCALLEDATGTPEEISACLLRRQRGLLVTATTADLIDWAYGGLLTREHADALPPTGCPEADTAQRFVCRHLPIRPVAPESAHADGASRLLPEGSLPPPCPPFAYQSLLLTTALDASGGSSQVGGRLVLLNQLGQSANWMTSYQVGLMSRSASSTESSQLILDAAYVFHFRWAARFLINAGPFLYGGLRGFGDEVSPFMGTGPSVGLSLLPEGWTKIPLEVSLTYRVPVTLLDSRYGFSSKGIRVEAQWIELAFGLAFM